MQLCIGNFWRDFWRVLMPLCPTRICLFKLLRSLNSFPQNWHSSTFPRCLAFRCWLKLPLYFVLNSQYRQTWTVLQSSFWSQTGLSSCSSFTSLLKRQLLNSVRTFRVAPHVKVRSKSCSSIVISSSLTIVVHFTSVSVPIITFGYARNAYYRNMMRNYSHMFFHFLYLFTPFFSAKTG